MFIYSIDTQSYNKREGLVPDILNLKKKIILYMYKRQICQATWLFIPLSSKGGKGPWLFFDYRRLYGTIR